MNPGAAKYLDRLRKIDARMFVYFFVLSVLILIFHMVIMYFYYIPKIEESFKAFVPGNIAPIIGESITKVVVWMSVWPVFFVMVSLLLLYILSNVKNLVKSLDKSP